MSTRPFRRRVPCPACGVHISTEDAFDSWVREHPDLDSRTRCLTINDGDKFVHRFGTRPRGRIERDVHYFMVVEVKTRGADMDASQRDTLMVADDLLRTKWRDPRTAGRFMAGHEPNTRTVYSYIARRKVQVISYGVHKLRMSGSTPTDSATVTWDNKPVTVAQLVELLRFDRNPDSLQVMEHRRHKRAPASLTLFPPGGAA